MRKKENIYFWVHDWERKVPLSAYETFFTTKKLSWTYFLKGAQTVLSVHIFEWLLQRCPLFGYFYIKFWK